VLQQVAAQLTKVHAAGARQTASNSETETGPCCANAETRTIPARNTLGSSHNGDEAALKLRATSGLMRCSKKYLLNHLIGEGDQRCRHGEAERFRGREVDDELEFGWVLHW
jgi:hypothetical protein